MNAPLVFKYQLEVGALLNQEEEERGVEVVQSLQVSLHKNYANNDPRLVTASWSRYRLTLMRQTDRQT